VILRNIDGMSSLSKLVNASRGCPISGSTDAVLVSSKDRHGKSLRNIMCQKSGLIYVDPVPFENTEEFYQTEYRKSYKGVHRPKPKHVYRAGKIALERYSRLSGLLSPSANCLDAGSSSGEFVYFLKSRDHNAQGVEANIPYAEYSQSQLEIEVSISPFSEFKTEEKFDLITMFHVLEHLEHPVRDLSHLGNFLKPEGYFVIEVPNIQYPNMAFSHKWHPGHLFSFSAQTLSMLMQKAGFKTISCEPVSDGGNLWGVFRLNQSDKNNQKTEVSSSGDELNILKKQRLKYYANPSNLVKFATRIPCVIAELVNSRGQSGREILDNLYKLNKS
jgi:2-polyprenyl-3-methyl-5-hydroxy-6-metoxy-1,4-benzoquinol methylase